MKQRTVAIGPETTVREAARRMLHHRAGALLVVDPAGFLVGIVTEGDLMRRTEVGAQRRRPGWLEFLIDPGCPRGEYNPMRDRKVAEVMTRKMITIAPSTPLQDVVDLMETHRIKRLPVLQRGRIVGIISRADLLRGLTDAIVRNGAIELCGVITDEHQHDALCMAVQTAPDVPKIGEANPYPEWSRTGGMDGAARGASRAKKDE